MDGSLDIRLDDGHFLLRLASFLPSFLRPLGFILAAKHPGDTDARREMRASSAMLVASNF